MAKYVHTDEHQDVLGSLEHCALSLQQARRSDRAWKWVVLSLHSALQGAMVCHLSGTAQLGALTKKSAEKWLERYDKDEDQPLPRECVASAKELFKRLSSPLLRIEHGCGQIIVITEKQQRSFMRLHNLRNEFSHFRPKGWSIELEFIEEVIEDVLDVLCMIQKDPWSLLHMPEEHGRVLRSKIEEIRSIVSRDLAEG